MRIQRKKMVGEKTESNVCVYKYVHEWKEETANRNFICYWKNNETTTV